MVCRVLPSGTFPESVILEAPQVITAKKDLSLWVWGILSF